jgi:regulator of protease activity HflC (stomatin/prohibitin superfamily)
VNPKMLLGAVIGAVAFLIAVTAILGSWYTIDVRERGVILRNGAFVGIAQPGLGFKLPWLDSVVKMSLETYKLPFLKMSSYSRDQQEAKLDVSVILRTKADGVDDLYQQYGSLQGFVDRVVAPRVNQQTKIVFGRFNAETAIRERGRLNTEIEAAVVEHVGVGNDSPVVIESVQLENIDFSEAYEKSIEQRMLAEVEVQKLRQNAEREKVQAEIVVTQAKAKADAIRAEAQAQADAIKLRGNAEAQAIDARGKALASNPALVTLVQAERWNGVLPVTMVPGGGVPMLALGK